ncbi:MAG: universal stress protein [Tissierellales bacterium]|nr:universal stress protein [Tissierellales bacterium]
MIKKRFFILFIIIFAMIYSSACTDNSEENSQSEGDYDLVVMRTHGMGATKRFMLGSVTNKVVHHIKKPILVVR